jgi:hypothetical protein
MAGVTPRFAWGSHADYGDDCADGSGFTRPAASAAGLGRCGAVTYFFP